MAKIITLYFSRTGQNYFDGSVVELKKGNTRQAAEYIQEAVGGDLFEIAPKKHYADDYYDCIREARKEHDNGERPEVVAYPENIEDYDVIFIGYPNWWGTCPMAVFTVLEKLDLKGKKLVPFCTNEGSGLGVSEREIASVCKGSTVLPGISIHGAEVVANRQRIMDWARASAK